METVLLVVHLIVAIALIGIVLLQRSEGGALGIGGSSGGGGNIFSARGVGNTLTRTTAYLAIAFFATSITLTLIATKRGGGSIFAPEAVQTDSQAAPAESQGTSGENALPKLPEAPKVPVSQ